VAYCSRKRRHEEKETSVMSFVRFLLVGLVAGWIVGRIMKGRG